MASMWLVGLARSTAPAAVASSALGNPAGETLGLNEDDNTAWAARHVEVGFFTAAFGSWVCV